MNGNGWVKPILIGVAIFVLGAVIVGSGTLTLANTVARAGTEVEISSLKEDVDENTKRTDGIDVMASQINDISEDVGKIREFLEQHSE